MDNNIWKKDYSEKYLDIIKEFSDLFEFKSVVRYNNSWRDSGVWSRGCYIEMESKFNRLRQLVWILNPKDNAPRVRETIRDVAIFWMLVLLSLDYEETKDISFTTKERFIDILKNDLYKTFIEKRKEYGDSWQIWVNKFWLDSLFCDINWQMFSCSKFIEKENYQNWILMKDNSEKIRIIIKGIINFCIIMIFALEDMSYWTNDFLNISNRMGKEF